MMSIRSCLKGRPRRDEVAHIEGEVGQLASAPGIIPRLIPSDIADSQSIHVISPGRSGTRWLADFILATSDAVVLHSSGNSLAQTGFWFDRGWISEEASWGSYLTCRSRLYSAAAARNGIVVDLDCKTSPLSAVIQKNIPSSRALVMLRDPIAFVLSGLQRGYFRTMVPVDWGHLCPDTYDQWRSENVDICLQDQLLAIAWFWNRIALYAQDAWLKRPALVSFAPPERLFSSPVVASECLSGLGLAVDAALVRRYKAFAQRKNAGSLSPTAERPSIDPLLLHRVRAAATNSLISEFAHLAGIDV
jgi:hypothetical protein